MKKKYMKYLLFFVVAFASFIMINKTVQTALAKKQIAENRKTLPDFSFQDLEGEVFKKKNLDTKKAIVVIHFNSGCEFCQYEAKELVKNADLFKQANILMVSSESLKEIKTFYKKYQLKELKNLKVLQSKTEDFYKKFGSNTVPEMFIYDDSGKLTKHFRGETKIEAIIRYL